MKVNLNGYLIYVNNSPSAQHNFNYLNTKFRFGFKIVRATSPDQVVFPTAARKFDERVVLIAQVDLPKFQDKFNDSQLLDQDPLILVEVTDYCGIENSKFKQHKSLFLKGIDEFVDGSIDYIDQLDAVLKYSSQAFVNLYHSSNRMVTFQDIQMVLPKALVRPYQINLIMDQKRWVPYENYYKKRFPKFMFHVCPFDHINIFQYQKYSRSYIYVRVDSISALKSNKYFRGGNIGCKLMTAQNADQLKILVEQFPSPPKQIIVDKNFRNHATQSLVNSSIELVHLYNPPSLNQLRPELLKLGSSVRFTDKPSNSDIYIYPSSQKFTGKSKFPVAYSKQQHENSITEIAVAIQQHFNSQRKFARMLVVVFHDFVLYNNLLRLKSKQYFFVYISPQQTNVNYELIDQLLAMVLLPPKAAQFRTKFKLSWVVIMGAKQQAIQSVSFKTFQLQSLEKSFKDYTLYRLTNHLDITKLAVDSLQTQKIKPQEIHYQFSKEIMNNPDFQHYVDLVQQINALILARQKVQTSLKKNRKYVLIDELLFLFYVINPADKHYFIFSQLPVSWSQIALTNKFISSVDSDFKRLLKRVLNRMQFQCKKGLHRKSNRSVKEYSTVSIYSSNATLKKVIRKELSTYAFIQENISPPLLKDSTNLVIIDSTQIHLLNQIKKDFFFILAEEPWSAAVDFLTDQRISIVSRHYQQIIGELSYYLGTAAKDHIKKLMGN